MQGGVVLYRMSVLGVSLIAALSLACTAGDGRATATVAATSEVTSTPRATEVPSATPGTTSTAVPAVSTATPVPTAAPTATVGPPRLERFAAGEVIDVAPAVVFVEPETGEAKAWVTPGATWPEFAVASDGSYVIYYIADRQYRLLRTDDGSDRSIEADFLPLEIGPRGVGFIATYQDQFAVAAFDGRGAHLGELWLGGLTGPRAVAWSDDGELISHALAPGGGAQMTLTITAVEGWRSVSVEAGPLSGGASLEWSHDSQRLALVTDDGVRVFDRDGQLLGYFGGEFNGGDGNPRWSPDDAYLYVGRMPRSGGEVASVFNADAEPLFRFFTPAYAGGCGGEVWIADGVLEFGSIDVSVDGMFSEHDRVPRDVYPTLESYGVVVAEGPGIHIPHHGVREDGSRTEDGRLVFSIPGIGHGGCGEGWNPSSVTEPFIEWPPYEDPR